VSLPSESANKEGNKCVCESKSESLKDFMGTNSEWIFLIVICHFEVVKANCFDFYWVNNFIEVSEKALCRSELL